MIREALFSDFDFVYDLYMHPSVNPYLLYEPMSRQEFEPVFNGLIEKNIKYIFSDEQEPAGMFKLVPLTYRTDHIVYLGGLAIHPRHAGKGFGALMMKELLIHAKSRGFLRVELSVATINEKAIRLYEQHGFEREGILRKYSHLKSKGKFLDEALMACML